MADEEKPEYFYRLVCLVVELGTEGLLKVLEKETHGEAIQSFLANRSSKIDNLRYKKKVLKEKQYKLLKAGNVSEFDISLLYVLIRNLTNLPEPIDKWDATYHRPSDTSPAANVARLKLVRNEAIAHCPKCCMKKSKFDESWTDAENALLGLARYYDEEDAMKNKIEQVKMKELIEGEECPLDKLVKWKFDEMGTKIEQVNQKVDELGSMPEAINAMKEMLTSIQGQLKEWGIDRSLMVPEARPVADGGPQTSEFNVLKKRMGVMEEFLCSYSIGSLQLIKRMDTSEPPIDHPNALSVDEIKEYSRELGRDWEIFAIYLGYRQVQIDRMKQTYPRQIETLLNNMLEKWHGVVARCYDENPKKLLAAAFTGIRDNRTACRILGDRKLVDEVKKLKPKPETEQKIQKIDFQYREVQSLVLLPVPAMINNYGGRNSINVFPEGQVNFQAEGVGNNMSSNEATTTAHLFKKTEDSTLSETDTNILAHCMKSVGSLVILHLGKDSCRGTVFHVGDRYVMTAYHVIEPIADEWYHQSVQVGSDHSVPAVFVNFNECPKTPPKSLYRLKAPCFKDKDLDIAILEIDNPDGHLPQNLPLCKSEKDLLKVSCITYGHPGSDKKHLDPNCDVLTQNSNEVRKAVEFFNQKVDTIIKVLSDAGKNTYLVESPFSGYDDHSGFLLNSFFEHGGSGGPAIDHSRPMAIQVVGIYLKGYPSFFYELPKEWQMEYGAQHRFEFCRKTSSIYKVLLSCNEELAKNIFE